MDCFGFTCGTQEQKITDTFLLLAPLTLDLTAKTPTTQVENARAQAQHGACYFLGNQARFSFGCGRALVSRSSRAARSKLPKNMAQAGGMMPPTTLCLG